MLIIDADRNRLLDTASHRDFDPVRRRWVETSVAPAGNQCSWREAASWLQRASGHPMRAPVAVVGPRQAKPQEIESAAEIGTALALVGFAIVCGGRQGVMEAVCRGAGAHGGLSIGVLPGPETDDSNPHVTVQIATGIGEARNAIIARAGFCLVAVGNSHGTLSEVAFGLHFGRPVFGLCGAPEVDGVVHCDDVGAAIDRVCRVALVCDDPGLR